METINMETSNEISPEELGAKFVKQSFTIFIDELRKISKANPSSRFSLIFDWAGVDKARAAKALLDESHKYNIDSITIRATREQYKEDVNAFMSGVKWEEI